ncbi:MAG: U32 family peptidase, partial [Gammaproteobacteria bacterium]|nr:U32 family peptidase [Gammaproteobacteria bacterium]
EYFIEDLNLENLQVDLFIPFKEIALIKNGVLFFLNGSKDAVAPINAPRLEKQSEGHITASMSLLISSTKDLHLCDESSAEIYFQLPDSLKNSCSDFIKLFVNNRRLIPWFPSVLIGEDYSAAVEFLQQVRPARIVTNNTGIAYVAHEKGISWIAGPYMNLVNSFSLLCLKKSFNCYGAFISNEINRNQIKRLKKPGSFKLFYSIYHPIVLMTSRVCMHHQVTGCKKNIVDDTCIQKCKKSSSITNLKDVSFFIDKERGGYHCVYNEFNFLNTDIVSDAPDLFSSYFVDLRDIKTSTKLEVDKSEIVKLFENHINGEVGSEKMLMQSIYPSTSTQYKKGI